MQKLVRVGVVGVLLVLGGIVSFAQGVAGPASKLSWDELGEVPTVANSSNYNIYVDGSGTAINVSSANCIQGPTVADSTCTIPFPAMTPGSHVLTMTQVSGGAESNKSTPVSLTFRVLVTPTGVRIVG